MTSAVRIWRAEGPTAGRTRDAGEVRELLRAAAEPPTVELQPRADGPGSSLDLPQLAAAAHRLHAGAPDFDEPTWAWSRESLRTPGICLAGEPIRFRAVPADDPAAYEYFAPDFHDRPLSVRPPLPARPELFVLNVLRQFGLEGVRVEAEPMPALYRGTGLGGSNLAHLAATILAAALSGTRLTMGQLYVAATQLENTFGVVPRDDGGLDFGVSLTGGQESLTALQGGAWDNVHLPTHLGPYGVASRELVPESRYPELARHLLLVNVGVRRPEGVTSATVNRRWLAAWADPAGAALHLEKPALAWRAAEALRTGDWPAYTAALRRYREVRAALSPLYLAGQDELAAAGKELGVEHFPLGAGLGTCLVTSPDAGALDELRRRIEASADPERGRVALVVEVARVGLALRGFPGLSAHEDV